MVKNNSKSKVLQSKKKNGDKEKKVVSNTDQVVTEPCNPVEKSVDMHINQVLVGVIQTELYERLLKPAFVCYAQQQNDEPLRQLVESIVTSIALTEDQETYRIINDISQRYLFYLEQISNDSVKNWDHIASEGACQYWRTQVFMMLIRNSANIFNLLLPEPQELPLTVFQSEMQDFFNGVDEILKTGIGHSFVNTQELKCSSLYHFSRGVSVPWTGYDAGIIFNLTADVLEQLDKSACGFALMSDHVIRELYPDLIKQIENTLYIDLIFTQYKKIYEDLCQAFEPDEPLPDEMMEMLHQRIRFDQAYQNAFDAILHGQKLDKPLHRSSRLDIHALNTFISFFNQFRYAAEHHLGLYIFYC